MRFRRLVSAVSAAALLAIWSPGIAGAAPGDLDRSFGVPPGFFGVSPQDGLTDTDYSRIKGVVGTVRVPVYWSNVEPSPGELHLEALDEAVGDAADAGVEILPFVYGSPSWIAAEPARPPLAGSDRAAWGRFLRILARRYGSKGEFWRGRERRRPIRRWQLWNEPNFPLFWAPSPSPRGYAELVAVGSRAIRAEDPRARIVLGGIAPLEGEPLPWEYLRRLYEVPGIERHFDAVGVHPYSGSLAALRYQLDETRRVMDTAGDGRATIEVTEFGVASAGDRRQSTMIKRPAGQARFLGRAYRMLLAARGRWKIAGAIWFTWRDWAASDPNCVFCQHAGLFDVRDRPKPAWRAFRRIARENR